MSSVMMTGADEVCFMSSGEQTRDTLQPPLTRFLAALRARQRERAACAGLQGVSALFALAYLRGGSALGLRLLALGAYAVTPEEFILERPAEDVLGELGVNLIR